MPIAPTVIFTATEYAYDGPASIPGGLTRIELVNAGEQEHSLWLIKLEDDKQFTDVMDVFATFETEPQMPAWMVWYGGVDAGPGQSSAYTIDLEPETYRSSRSAKARMACPMPPRGCRRP